MAKQIQKPPHWLDGHFALITVAAGEALGGTLVKVSGVVGETIFGEICSDKGETGDLPLVHLKASKFAAPISETIDAARLFPNLKAATSFVTEAEIILMTDRRFFAKNDNPAPEGTGLFVGALK